VTASTAVASGRFSRPDLTTIFSRYGTIISLVALVAFFSAYEGRDFASGANFLNILNQVAILAIMASGLTVCLVMGLFDLSIGSIATLGGFLAARWSAYHSDGTALLVIVAVVGVAVLIGVLNGIVVSVLSVSAFIATLAMGSILDGSVLGYSQTQTIQMGLPAAFLNLGQAKVGPVPMPVVIMFAVMVVLWVFLERTQPGRHFYAIGGNAEAARLAGIRIKWYAIGALTISAVCATFAGIVADANIGAGPPTGVGSVYLLDAYAAAFLGAATLRNGRFHIVGTLVGVLLLGVINNGLSILGAATYWQLIVKGVLLILAVFTSGVVSLRSRRA
jgi:ribose transport system permease protein